MSGNESPPKRELPWTDVEVAKLRRTFPTLSASALGPEGDPHGHPLLEAGALR